MLCTSNDANQSWLYRVFIYIYIYKEQFKLSLFHYSINLLLNLWGHRSLCTRMKTVGYKGLLGSMEV